MEFDFCLVASWPELSHKQVIAWGEALEERGNDVAIITPASSPHLSKSSIRTFLLSDQWKEVDCGHSADTVESRYGIPSLDHLAFTERLYFNLSRSQALTRAVGLANTIDEVFSEHSFNYTFQVRGPELHRLLAHYVAKHRGTTSVWAGFSPFDDQYALSTSLYGSWDDYTTVPFNEMSAKEIEGTREHMAQFREDRRFYAHDNDTVESQGTTCGLPIGKIVETLQSVRNRTRPGKLHDQVLARLRLTANRRLNKYQLPTVEDSRQQCRENEYVFFPLQYPIESRLTMFSPEFYDQSYLVEYLSRILPTSVDLFVKGHPNHPGRPNPLKLRKLRRNSRVQFLNHNLNAHEVIENAAAVVVVNNTVGYEAIYYQKPLFALGDPPYAQTPAVKNVNSLSRLPELLSEHLSTTVSERTAVESIHSLQKASHAGNRMRNSSEAAGSLVDSLLQFVDN